MIRTSHANTLFFIGVTRAFVKPSFFSLLGQYGFIYRKVPARMLSSYMPYEASTGMFVVQRRSSTIASPISSLEPLVTMNI